MAVVDERVALDMDDVEDALAEVEPGSRDATSGEQSALGALAESDRDDEPFLSDSAGR